MKFKVTKIGVNQRFFLPDEENRTFNFTEATEEATIMKLVAMGAIEPIIENDVASLFQ